MKYKKFYTFEDLYLIIMNSILWKEMFFSSVMWINSVAKYAYFVSSLLRILVIGLALVYLLCKLLYGDKIFFLIASILVICFYISFLISSDGTLFYTALLVIFAYKQNKDKILKCYSRTIVLIFLLTLFACWLGIAENYISVFTYGKGYALGTGHPNVLGAIILNIVFVEIYMHLKGHLIAASVLTFITAILVYKITVNRTVTILLFTMSILLLIYWVLHKTSIKFIFNIMKWITPVVIVLSLLLMIDVIHIGFISDTDFQIRFSEAQMLYRRYGVHFWGNNIKFISYRDAVKMGVNPIILDNGYLRILLLFGIICFVLFVISQIILVFRTSRRHDYILLFIISMFIIAGLMEKFIYTSYLNFTLLLIASKDETPLIENQKE